MPFRSERQAAYLRKNKPDVAAKFEARAERGDSSEQSTPMIAESGRRRDPVPTLSTLPSNRELPAHKGRY